jgi:MoxR-like ATPase
MEIMNLDTQLAYWQGLALELMQEMNEVIVGQEEAIRLMTIAIFARGHVLLEGDVGVGKTTLLRAFTRGIGGKYERIEGTVDLMPNDLVYHTYIGSDGRPRVDPGPLLRGGEDLSIFFFNEINRARPQVHALMLRIMAEKSLTAFNQEYQLPHMLVFADRNQVEREETFEIPSAARDRFMMEISISAPSEPAQRKALIFDTRYHNTDNLITKVRAELLPFDELNKFSQVLQDNIYAGDLIQEYALRLWDATKTPAKYGIQIEDIEMERLVQSGASPRGMAMLLKASKVHAWLCGRDTLMPEDLHAVFHETVAHRLVLNPMYEMQRTTLARALTTKILQSVEIT